jgi:Rhs family protein
MNTLKRFLWLLLFVLILDGCCSFDKKSPDLPQGVSRTITATSVDLNWAFNIESDLAGYHVYRQESLTTQRLTSSLISGNIYSDNSVVSGLTYRYSVTAVDQCGNESQPSIPVVASILQPLAGSPIVARLLQDGSTPNDRLEFVDLTTGNLIKSHDFQEDAFIRGSDLVRVQIGPEVYGLLQPWSGETHIYRFSDGDALATVSFPNQGMSIPGVEPASIKLTENGNVVYYGISINANADLISYKIPSGQIVGTQTISSFSTASTLAIEEDVDMLIHGVEGSLTAPPMLYIQTKGGELFEVSLPDLGTVRRIGKLPGPSEVAVDPVAMGDQVVFHDGQGNLLFFDRSTGANTTYERQANIQTDPQGTHYNDAARREADVVTTEDGEFGIQLTAFGHAYVLDRRKLNPNGSQFGQSLILLRSPHQTRSVLGVDPIIARYDATLPIDDRLREGRVLVSYRPNVVRLFTMDGTRNWTFEGPVPRVGSTGNPLNWEKNIDILLSDHDSKGRAQNAILRYGGNLIRVIRLSDGQLLHSILDSPMRQPSQGVDPVLTPDERYLIDISADMDTEETAITLHGIAPPSGSDPGTFGERITVYRTFPLPKLDVDLFIHASGSWAGYMDSIGNITLFEIPSGRIIRAIPVPTDFGGAVIGVDPIINYESSNSSHPDEDWVVETDDPQNAGEDGPPPDDGPPPPEEPPPWIELDDEPHIFIPSSGFSDPPPGRSTTGGGGVSVVQLDACACNGEEISIIKILEQYVQEKWPEMWLEIEDCIREGYFKADVTSQYALSEEGSVVSFPKDEHGKEDRTRVRTDQAGQATITVYPCVQQNATSSEIYTITPIEISIYAILPKRLEASSARGPAFVNKGDATPGCLVIACGESVKFKAFSCPPQCVELLRFNQSSTSAGPCTLLSTGLTPISSGISEGTWIPPTNCKIYHAVLACQGTQDPLAPIVIFVVGLDPNNEISGDDEGIVNEAMDFDANLCEFTNAPSSCTKGCDPSAGLDLLKQDISWTVTNSAGTYSATGSGPSYALVPPVKGTYEIVAKLGTCPPATKTVEIKEKPQEKGTSSVPPGTPSTQDPCPPKGGEDGDDVVDPVYLFSGEFYESVSDLHIKGRGLDFNWVRKYRSKIQVETPQGNGWDFSYNIFLEEKADDIAVHDGNTRSDLYRLKPDGTWSLNEFFRKLSKNSDSTYTLEFEDKGVWNFHEFDGSPQEGKVSSIVDRNGNTIELFYDAQGLLSRVQDTLDRDILITYNSAGNVEAVTDFASRVVRYTYYDGSQSGGGIGDLKSVTYPVVTGTPNGNDFPNGKTINYTYSTGFSNDKLNHNLLTITDGRRNDLNDPTFGSGPYLVNTYATTTDDTDPNFDRVMQQVWGGDIIDMVYVLLTPTAANQYTTNKTIINDRVGNVKEYYFDGGNRVTRRLEYTGRANPIQQTTETSNRPTGKLRPGDPDFFETRYEWNADSLKTRVFHPNGNITEYIYESDLNPSASSRNRGNLRVIRHLPGSHIPVGDQSVIEEYYEYDIDFSSGCCGFNFVIRHVDGRGFETLKDYDNQGNIIHIQHRIPSIVEDFEYNQFGQITKAIHPDNGSSHRREDVFTYYTHVEDDDQEGYLKQMIVDAGNFDLTTAYEYDLVGNAVKVTDPRGHDSQYVFNSLDQVVRERYREVKDGAGVRYEKDYFFDANDNIIKVDIQNIDDQGALQPNSHFTTTMEYEILNFLTKESEEVDAGRSIVYEYEYDENRNQVLTRTGEATNGNQPHNQIGMLYDERDLPIHEEEGAGGPDQSTTQYDYDGNRNLVTMSVGLENVPRVYHYTNDSYNRKVKEVDPLGNETLISYDARHNKTRIQLFGELNDNIGNASNIRLSDIANVYDAANRETRKETRFFDTETQSPIWNGLSIIQTFYSDNSQILRIVDDNNHEATIEYDTANRPHLLTDHKGNKKVRVFDSNNNIISITEIEKSDLGSPDETFVTNFTYDNLNREIKMVDNIGNITEHTHDSRDNIVRIIDAQRTSPTLPGNVSIYKWDGSNRLVQLVMPLTSDGTGTGTQTGTITLNQTWNDNSLLKTQTDDKGNTTTYTYDTLNRQIVRTYADGTSHLTTFDVHDNIVNTTDANGSITNAQYDLLNRIIRKDITPGVQISNSLTFEKYQYDGLSRFNHIEDDDSVVTRKFDSMSNIVEETLNGQTSTYTYDGIGNQLISVYPGGRTITKVFDDLDRPETIRDASRLIARYKYVGPTRVAHREYGNNTHMNLQYDGLKRITGTTHTHNSTGTTTHIDDRRYVWDALHNKTSRTDLLPGGKTHKYTYDSLYRLIQSTATQPAGITENIRYDLDGVGSRRVVTGGTHPGVYSQDSTLPAPGDTQLNQYTSTAFDIRKNDANGNLTGVNKGLPNEREIMYDYRNQMVEHRDLSTGIVTSYSYDAIGRRIQKTVNNGTPITTRYFYDKWQVVEEQDENANTLSTFVYGNLLDEVLNMQISSTDYFYHTDDLFNVMKISDASGAVVESYDYGDFGQPFIKDSAGNTLTQSNIANPYLFNGRRYDDETGFYYYRTRYLDPIAGRFTTRDIIGIWGDPDNIGNGYTYVGNNPWSRIDPLGLGFADAAEGVAVGLASGAGGFVTGLAEFAWNILTSPIDTAKGMYSGIKQLIDTIVDGNLGEAARLLFPRLHKLITQWDCLSDYEIGKIIGEIIGEYGAGILTGIGAAKIISRLRAARRAANSARRRSRASCECNGNGSCFAAETLIFTTEGYKPIADVEVGNRVFTTDDEVQSGYESKDVNTQFNKIELLVLNPDENGKVIEITLLRAENWLIANSCKVDQQISLSLHEIGIEEASAYVVNISKSHPIRAGPGRLVTGTFASTSHTLLRLTFTGKDEALSLTKQHPLFSITRQSWIPAAELEIGESIATRSGSLKLLSSEIIPGPHQVFNLEIQTAHNYYASTLGIVSHNVCEGAGLDLEDFRYAKRNDFHEPSASALRSIQRETSPSGYYNIKFKSGKSYAGKGGPERMQASGKRLSKEHGDPVKSMTHNPTASANEAFKGEARLIRESGGITDPSNYNRINSPGELMLREAGE